MQQVDIVISTFNNLGSLKETLDSVRQQDFKDYQCYVVDDFSTDNTSESIRKDFNWVRLLDSDRRNGPAYNRNRAVSCGNSPLIAFLDDDVVLSPDWLGEMVRFISQSSSIASVGSQLRLLRQPNRLHTIGGAFHSDLIGYDLFFNAPLDKDNCYLWRPLRLIYACSAAMLIKRESFYKAGGFDPHYFYPAEDYDLGIRLNLLGYLNVYNPRAIVYHSFHRTVRSFPRKLFLYLPWRNSLATILKNFSCTVIVRILPQYLLHALRSDPHICIKACIWNFFQAWHILGQRLYIRKRICIDEAQLFTLSTFLADTYSGNQGRQPGKPIVSWKRKAARKVINFLFLPGQIAKRFKNRPKYVDNIIFQVTNACNASCRHCFLRGKLNRQAENNLSLEEVRKFFASLGRIGNIVIGGGEPFLRPDLAQLCILIAGLSKPRLLTISTNGSLPDTVYRVVLAILENTRMSLKISLSLDALPGEHDRLRGIDGLFEKIQQSYDKLLFLYYIFYPRLSIQINSVVFKDNYATLIELYDLAGARFPLADFNFEAIRGHYDSGSVTPLSLDEYSLLVDSMRKHAAEKGDLSFLSKIRMHELALMALREHGQPVTCDAASNFIVLDFYGNLYPCEILPAFRNIRDIGFDFRRVLSDHGWRKVIKDIKRGNCYCTHMCFLSTSWLEDMHRAKQ